MMLKECVLPWPPMKTGFQRANLRHLDRGFFSACVLPLIAFSHCAIIIYRASSFEENIDIAFYQATPFELDDRFNDRNAANFFAAKIAYDTFLALYLCFGYSVTELDATHFFVASNAGNRCHAMIL